MSIITTSGYAALLGEVAVRARQFSAAAQAFRTAAGLDGRVAEELYSAALSVEERELLHQFDVTGAFIKTEPDRAEPDAPMIRLNRYGRAIISPGSAEPAHDDLLIGYVRWPDGRAPQASARLFADREETARDDAATAAWLAAKHPDEVRSLLADLSHTLQRLGPVLLYCDDAHFTNIGRLGNLVGRSIAADSDQCTLHRLRATPAHCWTVQQQRFVTCLSILRRSGTASRTGELNGTQISLERLREFLLDRLADYGVRDVPELPANDRVGAVIELSRHCSQARESVVRRGGVPWRSVNALIFNKSERIDWSGPDASMYPSVPAVMSDYGLDPRGIDSFTNSAESRMAGFLSAGTFDDLLRDLLLAVVRDSASDVAMSRGPRDIAALAAAVRDDSAEPAGWKTNAYFCCVVPSPGMVRRFTGEPDQLAPALKAMSARMRWNCWHFMPHAIGKQDADPRRDWFFAPVIPDHTAWSDQHHQGHVANGVRHAIRVPIACRLAQRSLPGIYDLRLMRVDGAPYTAAELKAARDFTAYLGVLHQVRADRLAECRPGTHAVTAFDNKWFDRAYGPQSVLETMS